MSLTPRQTALRVIASSQRFAPSQPDSRPLSELFGANVFNDALQRQRLPKPVYKALRRTIDKGEGLDPEIADAVANAMKDWAVERGATHFTHWFQPMTGLTAEKHDSFLNYTAQSGAVIEFSGKELIKGEPDASSFPSGGIRATFEARGYTAWDPTSPAFLRETAHGLTLTIPTAFCSWTGEALDLKTPLLRSQEALNRQACRMLKLLGDKDVKHVRPTLGVEQEYFLIDQHLYLLRPDMVTCGRSLVGARPAKGQELEDHYFGALSERVLAFMMETERELWKLGIPVRTRHNEVAPGQFEMAPIFEDASVAIDHNMLMMEVMQVVAERHGLKCLLHEKPFAGVNGSGKHNNWSLADDKGNNLLEPGHTPQENLKFMVFLTAILRAVDTHQDLVRASVAHAGNDHRLGANEAPPAIISVFLGTELESIIEALVRGTEPRGTGRGESIKLGVTTLPPLPRDSSDRNRTSPFAFTGNKFEFRAVGSSQSSAYPNIVLNTAVAESLDNMCTELESRAKGGDVRAGVQGLVRELLAKHQRILFNGDGYSQEWEQEAARRGLLNCKDTPSALVHFASEKNLALFEKYQVFQRRETESRSNVQFSAYVHRLVVEAQALASLASTSILPAAIEFQHRVASSLSAARAASAKLDLDSQEELLVSVAGGIHRLRQGLARLEQARLEVEAEHSSPRATAELIRAKLVEAMRDLRKVVDLLETQVDDQLWPLPKYRELLFVK